MRGEHENTPPLHTTARDVDTVLSARYWLTPAGVAATDEHMAAVRLREQS